MNERRRKFGVERLGRAYAAMVNSLARAREAVNVETAHLSLGETAYQVVGEDGPWVVLVHGLLTPSYAWEDLAEVIAAQGFRVLRYDQFGRGLSERPAVRYDLDLYVAQFTELTEALGIDELHVVGWSMGGLILTQFTAEHPDRVKSVALIAPALYLKSRSLQALRRVPMMGKVIASRIGNVVDRMETQHLSRPERFPDYGLRAREQLQFPGVGESFASTVEHMAFGAGDQWRVAGQHQRPVLVVWGDNDRVTSSSNAHRVMQLYPRARLVLVAGGRHAPHLDHAEVVTPELLRHLRLAADRSD